MSSAPIAEGAVASPTEKWAVGAVVLGLVAMLFFRMGPPVADVDIWHLMGLAREVWTERAFPTHDPFAYTPTKEPVVHHEWGSGMVLYAITCTLGGTGVVALRYLAAVAIMGMALGLARWRGASWGTLAFAGPLFVVMIGHGFSTVRAQVFSLLALCLLLWMLEWERAGKHTRWWWWAVGFVAWVNLHGGFVLGGGLLGVYGIEQIIRGQPWKRLALYGLSLVLLVSLNPWGWHYYGYLLKAVTMKRPGVAEWEPLFPGGSLPLQMLFVLSIGFLIIALLLRGWRNTPGCLMVLATALLTLNSQRMMLFYSIVWLSLVPSLLQETAIARELSNLWQRQRAILTGFWLLVGLGLCAMNCLEIPWRLRVPDHPQAAYPSRPYYPVGLCDYLKQHKFQGNMLTHFNVGAYVSWKLYPQVLVSLDSRYEAAYSDELANLHDDFYLNNPGGVSLLTDYPPDVVLILRRLPIAKEMPQLPAWKLVYRDPYFDLYARPDSTLPNTENHSQTVYGAFP